MCQIFQIIPTIEKFAGNRLQSSAGNTFIPYYIAYLGQPYQNTGAIFVTQSALYIKLLEQFVLNPGCILHILGEFVNDIFFLHIREFLGVYSFYYFFCKCRRAKRDTSGHKTSKVMCGTSLAKTGFQGIHYQLRRLIPAKMFQHHDSRED